MCLTSCYNPWASSQGSQFILEGYSAHAEVHTNVYSGELTLDSFVSTGSPLTAVAS